MKNLGMKMVTLLFVCICIMSVQIAQAKCCGKNNTEEVPKATVVERIKKKISQILNKNNATEEIEEAEEIAKTQECLSEDGQCPLNRADCDEEDVVVEGSIASEQIKNIDTLSATEVIETITALIAQEIEASENGSDHVGKENSVSAR